MHIDAVKNIMERSRWPGGHDSLVYHHHLTLTYTTVYVNVDTLHMSLKTKGIFHPFKEYYPSPSSGRTVETLTWRE